VKPWKPPIKGSRWANKPRVWPESFSRISYLYKIAKFMKQRGLAEVSRHYLDGITQVAEKNVARIDSSIKSKFCKKCNNFIDWDFSTPQELSGLTYLIGNCSLCSKTFKFILGNSDNIDLGVCNN
jgi:RNase P subunit RPR2